MVLFLSYFCDFLFLSILSFIGIVPRPPRSISVSLSFGIDFIRRPSSLLVPAINRSRKAAPVQRVDHRQSWIHSFTPTLLKQKQLFQRSNQKAQQQRVLVYIRYRYRVKQPHPKKPERTKQHLNSTQLNSPHPLIIIIIIKTTTPFRFSLCVFLVFCFCFVLAFFRVWFVFCVCLRRPVPRHLFLCYCLLFCRSAISLLSTYEYHSFDHSCFICWCGRDSHLSDVAGLAE